MDKKTHQRGLKECSWDKLDAAHLPLNITDATLSLEFLEEPRNATNRFGDPCFSINCVDLKNDMKRTLELSYAQAKSLKAAMQERGIKTLTGTRIEVDRFQEGKRYTYMWATTSHD